MFKMRNRGFEVVSDEFRKHKGVVIRLPQKATKGSSALDFFSPIDIIIKPQDNVMIWTDVKAYLNSNEVLLLNVRSSMGKCPIMLSNTQGWIDPDYYSNADNGGNIGLRLFNLGSNYYIIKVGDRIGQGMFTNSLPADSGDSENERVGGFGSTGK